MSFLNSLCLFVEAKSRRVDCGQEVSYRSFHEDGPCADLVVYSKHLDDVFVDAEAKQGTR